MKLTLWIANKNFIIFLRFLKELSIGTFKIFPTLFSVYECI